MPETAARRLAERLKRHKLWDFVSIVFPPVVGASYLILFLFFRDLLSSSGLLVASVVVVAAAVTVWEFSRRGWKDVSPPFAARLIDRRVGGQDRFITLATIPPSFEPSPLFLRLRREAASLLRLLDVRKDFHYRFKPGFFFSIVGSVAAVVAFHLALLMFFPSRPYAAARHELALLAERLYRAPGLSDLARRLEATADRIEEPALSTEEKVAAVQEMRREVESRTKREQRQGPGNDDLLNQAADALEKIEKGLEGDREEGEGAGLKSDLAQEKGAEKESGKGGGGEGKGESADSRKEEIKGERTAQQAPDSAELPAESSDKNKGRKTNIEQEKEKGPGMEGRAKGDGEGKSGKMSEEIPKGPAPERFAKPGEEGPGGIKGSRFVIVELPELFESSGPSESAAKEESGKKSNPKTPIGNAPLPRAVAPQISAEKQPVPLEYRDLIR